MTFGWPWMLMLAAVPGLLLVAQLAAGRSGGQARADLDAPGGQIQRGAVVGGRLRFGAAAGLRPNFRWRFWLAFLLVVVALARPQWGAPDVATDPVTSEVVIALDLSRSMLAQDVLPTRLKRARSLAVQLVDALPEHRMGLIGFAATAHVLAAPSEDRSLLRSFLVTVRPEHVLEQGTSFTALLDTTTAAFGSAAPTRLLVIFSDGEAASAAWRERLPSLRQQGVRVVAVGIGTAAGSLLSTAGNRPLRDSQGNQVRSRLDPHALTEIANASHGAYLESPDVQRLVEQVRAVIREPAKGSHREAGAIGAGAEKFIWFLATALLMLTWSAACEWPAVPHLCTRSVRRLASVGLAGLCLGVSIVPQASMAARPVVPDLRGQEMDPLTRVKAITKRLLAKNELGADDYRELAEASVRYGEVHRGHGHPLSTGVLRDGLAAIEQGRRLDPTGADWRAMDAKLRHLLQPPPPVPEADPGPPDPANEPVDGKQQVPIIADTRRAGEKRVPGDEKTGQAAERQGMRAIGGSRRDVYDPAEWRNPSLVQPLYRLEQIRAAASPAELFRLRQAPVARSRQETDQTW